MADPPVIREFEAHISAKAPAGVPPNHLHRQRNRAHATEENVLAQLESLRTHPSVAAAAESLKTLPYDLVLMDMQMPAMLCRRELALHRCQ